MLWPELRDKFGFKYLLTRRLTQDCIENLFSVIRYRGGNNSNPDPALFRTSLRKIMMNNLSEPAEYGNSEQDLGEFLLKARDLREHRINLISHGKLDEVDVVQPPTVDMAEKNALSYVTGWAACNGLHEKCQQSLTQKDSSSADDTLILLKRYEGAHMLFPSELGLEVAQHIHGLFLKRIDDLLAVSREGVKRTIVSELSLPDSLPVCDVCLKKFSSRLLNVLLNSFVKAKNDELLAQKQRRRNRKAKIVMHE